MNSTINIKPFIGVEKTVLITCTDFRFEDYAAFENQVFIHFAPESQLHQYDHEQQKTLQHYIETKGCAQIIFIGSMNPGVIDRILKDNSLQSPLLSLKFNLSVLLRTKQDLKLDPVLRHQILIELNVIAQCKLLMNYYFLRERVEKKELQIRGVVTKMREASLKSIFCNGIIYNDIISTN